MLLPLPPQPGIRLCDNIETVFTTTVMCYSERRHEVGVVAMLIAVDVEGTHSNVKVNRLTQVIDSSNYGSVNTIS